MTKTRTKLDNYCYKNTNKCTDYIHGRAILQLKEVDLTGIMPSLIAYQCQTILLVHFVR